MIIRGRSFPHPVLAPFTDDVTPAEFSFSITVSPDADNYYLDVRFNYENQTLAGLIATGAAVHSLHLECRRNFYRELFSFKERTTRLTIRAADIVGRVEASAFVKAQEAISDYAIVGAHMDYGSATFDVKAGDVLAVATSKYFDAFVDYDPLRRISSILSIRRSEDVDEGPMSLDTSGDLIVATLSQKDYDRYTDLKADPNLGPLLANQVIIPALLEATHEIKNTSDDDLEIEMSRRWFRSVHKHLEDLGLNIRSHDVQAIEAVQAILKLPLRRSLEGLIQMNPLDEAL